MSDPIAQLIEAARAYRAAEEALDAFEDQPTRPGYHEAHKAEDRVPVHMAVVDAMARLDEVLRALGDAVPRCLLNSAHYYGSLAYRQRQPLDDNPHKRGSPEWHAWVSGWQLIRNVSEELEVKHARALVEAIHLYEGKLQWAEQVATQAMEAGLEECDGLRGRLASLAEQLAVRTRTLVDVNKALVDTMDRAETAEEELSKWMPTPEEVEARMAADAPAIKARLEAYCSIASELDEPPGPLCGSMEHLKDDDEGDW